MLGQSRQGVHVPLVTTRGSGNVIIVARNSINKERNATVVILRNARKPCNLRGVGNIEQVDVHHTTLISCRMQPPAQLQSPDGLFSCPLLSAAIATEMLSESAA